MKILAGNTNLRGSLVATLLLGAAGALGLTFQPTETPPPRAVAIEALPRTLGDWRGKDVSTLGFKTREVLQLTSYVRRLYSKNSPSGEPTDHVFLYVGYWATQSGDTQAAKHSPAMCLPANGWKTTLLGTEEIPLSSNQLAHNHPRPHPHPHPQEGESGGSPRYTPPSYTAVSTPSGELTSANEERQHDREVLHVNRIIGERENRRVLFLYLFFTGEEYLPEEWRTLIATTLNAAFGKRTDGGIIEVSTAIPPGDDGLAQAENTLRTFLSEFFPIFDSLHSTRRRRGDL